MLARNYGAILALSGLSCAEPTAVAPRALEITFARNAVLYATDTSGATQTPLIAGDTSGYEPTWSSDGRYVAFTRQTPVGPSWDYQIFVFDTRTGAEAKLTEGPRDNFSPAWAPGSETIAYLSRSKDTLTDATLNIIHRDGTNARQLGTARYYVRAPSWSPLAQHITATSGALEIVIVDAVTGAVERSLGPGISPEWSPQGNTIAFVCTGQSAAAICLIDADGQNLRLISDSADYQPAWSPDGSLIAVETNRSGTFASPDLDIVVMKADGSGQRRITEGPAWDREPAWRIRP
jgi:TolB protein